MSNDKISVFKQKNWNFGKCTSIIMSLKFSCLIRISDEITGNINKCDLTITI